MTLTIEQVRDLLRAMELHNRHATIDWGNRRVMVLSESIPTYKKDGTRLMLSDGPASHQEYLFHIRG